AESEKRAARSAERRRRYDEAFAQFLAGKFAQARDGFAAVLAAEPSDTDARAMLLRTEQALAQSRASERPATVAPPAQPARTLEPAPAASETAPLSREQQRLVADLYHRGVAAMEARHPAAAVRYWEAVWAIRPGYERVDQYL